VHNSQRPRWAGQEINVALCVPLGGSAGLWGPSALASAELAVAELNAATGLAGRPCRLVTVNAADNDPAIESTLIELVDSGDVDALVGLHTSAVRQRIVRAVGGRLPFVYTPLYEGGERTPGVFAIGETTTQQLRPVIHWLSERKRPRRWYFVGNDYVWPHVAHRVGRACVIASGAEVVGECFLPFGTTDYSSVLDQIRRLRCDAVMLSLIGQDEVDFNRAFGRAGLASGALRLSSVIAENELLGIGAENTENLYVAAGYFADLDTDANLAFKERYLNRFGARAPTLNTFGQSTYEGIHFLASLFETTHAGPQSWEQLARRPLGHLSARDIGVSAAAARRPPIYLAQADGHLFRVIARL
jgi:ABC-type branched-subunit amino acid transport system substrate-binding protein